MDKRGASRTEQTRIVLLIREMSHLPDRRPYHPARYFGGFIASYRLDLYRFRLPVIVGDENVHRVPGRRQHMYLYLYCLNDIHVSLFDDEHIRKLLFPCSFRLFDLCIRQQQSFV